MKTTSVARWQQAAAVLDRLLAASVFPSFLGFRHLARVERAISCGCGPFELPYVPVGVPI